MIQDLHIFYCYTEWKENKCHPFNSRRGRLKGPKNVHKIWGQNLIVFSEKVFLVLFCSRRTAYKVTDNAKKFTSVGLSYKNEILISKICYVFYVVYVKSSPPLWTR